MKRFKVGLVLGGGGARGLAHIGVIKRLLHHGISVDVVTGASMGAIIGAAFAQTADIQKVEQNFRNFFNSKQFQAIRGESVDLSRVEEPENFVRFISNVVKRRIIINLAANRISLINGERLSRGIKHLVADGRIEEMAIPFACTSLDLISGEEIVFDRGDVHQALTASASIPGYLPPVEKGGAQLVDGAVIDNFPVQAAKKLGARFIIASDVSLPLKPEQHLDNVIDIFLRTHQAVLQHLNRMLRDNAHVVLVPRIEGLSWTEFEKIDLFIQRGEEVVDQNIEWIKKLLKRKSSLFWRMMEQILKWIRRV